MVAAPPVSGGGWTMSRSTPGSTGTITPSERFNSSPRGAPVSGAAVGGSSGVVVARGVFSCTSGGAGGNGLSVCAHPASQARASELRLGGSAFVRGCVRLFQHLLLMLGGRQRTTTSSACIHVLAARGFAIRF